MSPLSPHEQLWRLVTSFLFAGSGLNLLFDAFLFHRTSASLETDTYLLDGAKYAWSLLWIAVGIQVRLPTCSKQLQLSKAEADVLRDGHDGHTDRQLQNVLYFQTYFLFRPFVRLPLAVSFVS